MFFTSQIRIKTPTNTQCEPTSNLWTVSSLLTLINEKPWSRFFKPWAKCSFFTTHFANIIGHKLRTKKNCKQLFTATCVRKRYLQWGKSMKKHYNDCSNLQLTNKLCQLNDNSITEIFIYLCECNIPTMVSHLDVVVGLCTDDPKDF